jgi:hypothetical protein
VRRRDFTIGLLLAAAAQSAQTQERAKQHRIAIVIPAGAVAIISETKAARQVLRGADDHGQHRDANPCRLPLKLCHQLR